MWLLGCAESGRQGAARTLKWVCSFSNVTSLLLKNTFWRLFCAAVWKESIIGNKELVIHLTGTFHLSLSQRHSCLILWIAVAQQMCRVLIVKWILLVFFFLPPPLTVSVSVCSGCGGILLILQGVLLAWSTQLFSCWHEPNLEQCCRERVLEGADDKPSTATCWTGFCFSC